MSDGYGDGSGWHAAMQGQTEGAGHFVPPPVGRVRGGVPQTSIGRDAGAGNVAGVDRVGTAGGTVVPAAGRVGGAGAGGGFVIEGIRGRLREIRAIGGAHGSGRGGLRRIRLAGHQSPACQTGGLRRDVIMLNLEKFNLTPNGLQRGRYAGTLRLGAGVGELGDHDGRQYAQDDHHDENFNERKTACLMFHVFSDSEGPQLGLAGMTSFTHLSANNRRDFIGDL